MNEESKNEPMYSVTITDLLNCYRWGVDYGLLLAEEERDSEELFDAVGCSVYSGKICVPSTVPLRRQTHSVVWRKEMRAGMLKLIELIKNLGGIEA